MTFDDFKEADVDTGDARIHVRHGGSGPPVLLLHGFPQTHVMWRDVAPRLAAAHSVVCADLRGYGQSGCPASSPDHAPYANRTMARDMVAVMHRLGFERFCIAGHDRGGRVAYRLALDHPARVERLAVLDIVPTLEVWARADQRISDFWPWILLSQPEPLPERLIGSAPEAVIDDALGGWGSPPDVFDARTRAAYVAALRDPANVHAICEEYRAGASSGIDVDHDRQGRSAGRRIEAPVLVLWSAKGPLATWYAEAGGPLGLWREWAGTVTGRAIDGGHFFPEELPQLTADLLTDFFLRVR